MALFHVNVGRIRVQKDDFVRLSGEAFDDEGFFGARDKEAVVREFKRVVVDCDLSHGTNIQKAPFQIVIHVRSNLVIIRGTPIPARMVAIALLHQLRRWSDPPTRIKPSEIRSDDKLCEFIASDAMWVAGVLHDLSERGGFEGEAEMGPHNDPFVRVSSN